MSLHNLSPKSGSKKTKKRLGRGIGSTLGKTSGRGMKGQKSRSGASGFQRLGMRKLMLATPKLRGFNSPYNKPATVNVGDLAAVFLKGELVSPDTLKAKNLIATKKNGVKILSDGEVTVSLKVSGCKVSKAASEKITAAGGTINA
ncbi:MAG: 50S ribosomal protein L15 [bacterium]|nr:50S ribosomal protein L15 [bacterium]